MTNKETHPSAATLEQVKEKTDCDTSSSMPHYNTDSESKQLKVSDFLGGDRQTAITGRKLGEMMNVDPRTVQAMIERERRSGALSCGFAAWILGNYKP